jgi:hypothetical protein
MAREKELTVDDKFELLLTTLAQKQAGGLDRETLKELLTETAKVTQKAMKPENDAHPQISAFTKPEGYRANPHEPLACDTFYRGFPIHKAYETHTWREIELLNQVQPGSYQVIWKDKAPRPVEVTGERNASGALTKKLINFDVTREERHYAPSMFSLLYQIVHAQGDIRKAYVAAEMKELEFSMESFGS